ncbi:MAG: hypothetical protein PCFJNLEI_01308 [Verrucomicrobiae bacterium]|nr:hypothetical protein [Verrucomicrobiae bacterium]
MNRVCGSVGDTTHGIELNKKVFKLVSWYDNEWGYSCRTVDPLTALEGCRRG